MPWIKNASEKGECGTLSQDKIYQRGECTRYNQRGFGYNNYIYFVENIETVFTAHMRQ